MVDTFEVFGEISKQHIEYLEEDMGIKHNQLRQVTSSRHANITLTVGKSKQQGQSNYVYVIVNVPRFLNRGIITEADRAKVESEIAALLNLYFGDPKLLCVMKLKRFDYRLDITIESEEQRRLYIELLNRAKSSLRNLQKDGMIDARGNTQSTYETSVIHENGSVQTIVYDKNEERKDKKQKCAPWEESVLRFEVKVKKGRLTSQKSGKFQLQPMLSEYWTVEQYKRHLNEYLLKIYFSGNYYTMDLAKKIIRSSQLNTNMQEKLIDMLLQISRGNINTPLKSMSETTYRKRLKLLEDIQVNPCTIRQSERGISESLINLIDDAIRKC